jgi:hypothetical protein
VGEPLTFTITGFCRIDPAGVCISLSPAVTDTLPDSVRFVSATARLEGTLPPLPFPPPTPTCTESGGTVTCGPEFFGDFGALGGEIVDFVVEIVVIPTQCGTFTNTAADSLNTVSLEFTVCEKEVPQQPSQQLPQQPGPVTQEAEQDSESGEIDQTIEVSSP